MIEGLKKFQNVGNNKNGFIKYQYKRSLVTRNLYNIVGAPTFKNAKMMISKNIIHNCTVTVEDIEIAKKIFGLDVSTLKVRTTRKILKVVVNSIIELPGELIDNNQELIMFMDIIFINQQALFTNIDKGIRISVLVPLYNRTNKECYKDLDVVTRH